MTLFGCLDDIEVQLPEETGGRLVIAGRIQRSPDIYQFLVEVSRTTELENYLIDYEKSVEIRLIYTGSEILTLPNNEALMIGIEEFHDLYGGAKEDATFNIKIILENGSVFLAEEQGILDPPADQSLSTNYEERSTLTDVESVVTRGYVILNTSTSLINSDGQRISMLYSVGGIYRFLEGGPPDKIKNVCYVPDLWPKNEIIVLNAKEVVGDTVQHHKLTETIADSRFSAGYYFNVVAGSITQDAATYWQEVGQSIKRDGSIFDVPVGAVRTNVRQMEGDSIPVLGYFYTAGIDTIRFRPRWEETGRQGFHCDVDPFKDGCENCLTLEGSRLERPWYWVD